MIKRCRHDLLQVLALAMMQAFAVHAAVAATPTTKPAVAKPVAAKPAAAATSPSATSSKWIADPARSQLEFQFVQAGAKTQGRFARFNAQIDFDAATPATSRIDVGIDMASVDTRDKERDDALKTADLFDATKFLRANYLATHVMAKGASFEGHGKLTLKGISKDVPINFTFVKSVQNGQPVATMKGTATIKRLLFGVGQGEWKNTEWIADEVLVSFNLLLQPRADRPRVPAAPAPAQRQ